MNRASFPALRRMLGSNPVAYVDGPGGTQMPESVISTMATAARSGICNTGGLFLVSKETEAIVEGARLAVSDFLGCASSEVIFGQNMTSLTYAISRSLSRTWTPGQNVVLTRSDHDANVAPWLQAAADRGVEVRWLDVDPADGCRLRVDTLRGLADANTQLVAATCASNATGSLTDVARVVQAAREKGALAYVDAVHFAPHASIDVRQLGSPDFLVCSAYKFFGPHVGILHGKASVLDALDSFKLRPTPDAGPHKWEHGTQSYEGLAGVASAINYIASIGGEDGSRRSRLERAFARITAHERELSCRFLERVLRMDRVQIYGIHDVAGRTPTFALDVDGMASDAVAAALGDAGIFAWSGHFYAWELIHRLGLSHKGLVRIGFVHYNTVAEVDRACDELERIIQIMGHLPDRLADSSSPHCDRGAHTH